MEIFLALMSASTFANSPTSTLPEIFNVPEKMPSNRMLLSLLIVPSTVHPGPMTVSKPMGFCWLAVRAGNGGGGVGPDFDLSSESDLRLKNMVSAP
jgi:hypothetical protein